jgi:formylglycine-generating enzyme required for sulfatase activity
MISGYRRFFIFSFSFLGTHRVMVGDEDFWGNGQGQMKEVVFGPRDSFALGQVPVTQLMYFLAALGRGVEPTPSEFKEGEGSVVLSLDGREYRMKPNHPVERVNFDEALAHAARVSEILGGVYGLPSEKKWEFANRAGSSDLYHFGNDEFLLPKYGWFYQNSGRGTQAVGELLPNAYGLYDTHGNVSEWTSSKKDLSRVIRGGGWNHGTLGLRSAYRGYNNPGHRYGSLGFRLERTGLSKAEPSYTFTLGEPEPAAKPGPAFSVRRLYLGILNFGKYFRGPGK